MVRGDDFLGRQPDGRLEPRPQRAAPDVGHHVERMPGRFARIVERENVGVLQVGDGGDLPEELSDADPAHRFGGDDLHRDEPAVARVPGKVDGPHATLTQLGIDQVAIGDGATEIGIGPRRDPALDLEQFFEREPQNFEHRLPTLGRGIGVLAVDDFGPVSSGEPELQGPVVLAQGALGQECEEPVLLQADAHRSRIGDSAGITVLTRPHRLPGRRRA